ncbi:MAG: tetratricopeptide repeat protein [Methylacidiphilales bacterium]|nr:tetratricopeptide repeat protein [Candidatus Methylacidiphilales bacterium]
MSLKSERDLNATSRNQVARAKAAAQSKNYDYTINLMQAALKDEPLFLEGRRFLRAVEIQKYEALSSFSKQMLNMKVTGAAMKLSSAAKKEPGEQLAMAEEVLALDPFNHKANMLVADAGVVLGFPDFKAFAYETLSKGKPNDKAILNTLASAYMEMKDAAKAEKTYERILEIDPRDGDALSGLKNASAAHASKSGGWETATDYRSVLKSKSESEQLEQAGKVVKSTEAIDEQIQLAYEKHKADPTNALHPKAIAQLFLQKDDYGSAIQWYQYAFEIGNKTDPSLEKIVGDLKLKKADQELHQLREGFESQVDPEQKAAIEAEIATKERELLEARLYQAEARVHAYPNEGQFHFELGEALYKLGEYKRALPELQLGLKQPSVRYHAFNLMGLCFLQQGMLDLAIKRFLDAKGELAVMDELKKEIVYNLGLAYEKSKQADKSLEQWKEIYEVDMAYRDVSKRVEESYGQGDQAV